MHRRSILLFTTVINEPFEPVATMLWGGMDRDILIIGHSHLGAYRTANKIRELERPEATRVRTVYLKDAAYGVEMEGDDFSPALKAAIRKEASTGNSILACALGGSAHALLTIFATERIDFVLSGDDALPIDLEATLITETEMAQRLNTVLRADLHKLRLLHGLIGPYWHMESPPPVRRSDWMEERVAAFRSANPTMTASVAEPGIRYRTWRLANRIIKTELDRMGCGYVSVPPGVCGEAGMLRPSHGGDAFHGNNHFGEAMLQELERLAG